MTFKWWLIVARIWEKTEDFLSWAFPNWNREGTVFEFVRVIKDREMDSDYLIRYYLLSTRWLKNIFPGLSYRLTLHHTLRSDEDGLHDHPWNWKSRILQGGYYEETPEAIYWRDSEGGWRSRKSTDFHRLILSPSLDEETWSLFLMGPRKKDWGFLSKYDEWIQWQEYIANRDKYCA